jgi:hypothetical protein
VARDLPLLSDGLLIAISRFHVAFRRHSDSVKASDSNSMKTRPTRPTAR